MDKIGDALSTYGSRANVFVLPQRRDRTFGPNDKRAFVAADPGNEWFLKAAIAHRAPEGMVAVGNIPTGAYESYGPNRNGDAFDRYWSTRNHDTYVKFARYYRSHIAGPDAKHYGKVAASHFNRAMDRVELLLHLYESPKVAAENGGHVADWELAKLANDDVFPTSMGCSVPHDVCDICGNTAVGRAQYCRRECPSGGCYSNMGKVASINGELRRVFVHNPRPKWKDISGVGQPADMISYGTAMSVFDDKTAAVDLASPVAASPVHRMALAVDRIDAMADRLGSQLPVAAFVFPEIKTAEDLAAAALAGAIVSLGTYAVATKRASIYARCPALVTGRLSYGELHAAGLLPDTFGPSAPTKEANSQWALRTNEAVVAPIFSRHVTAAASSKPAVELAKLSSAERDLVKDYASYRLGSLASFREKSAEPRSILLTTLATAVHNR